jgi:hypothetical protein
MLVRVADRGLRGRRYADASTQQRPRTPRPPGWQRRRRGRRTARRAQPRAPRPPRGRAARPAKVMLAVRAHEVGRAPVWLAHRSVQRELEQFGVLGALAPAQCLGLVAGVDNRPPPVARPRLRPGGRTAWTHTPSALLWPRPPALSQGQSVTYAIPPVPTGRSLRRAGVGQQEMRRVAPIRRR